MAASRAVGTPLEMTEGSKSDQKTLDHLMLVIANDDEAGMKVAIEKIGADHVSKLRDKHGKNVLMLSIEANAKNCCAQLLATPYASKLCKDVDHEDHTALAKAYAMEARSKLGLAKTQMHSRIVPMVEAYSCDIDARQSMYAKVIREEVHKDHVHHAHKTLFSKVFRDNGKSQQLAALREAQERYKDQQEGNHLVEDTDDTTSNDILPSSSTTATNHPHHRPLKHQHSHHHQQERKKKHHPLKHQHSHHHDRQNEHQAHNADNDDDSTSPPTVTADEEEEEEERGSTVSKAATPKKKSKKRSPRQAKKQPEKKATADTEEEAFQVMIDTYSSSSTKTSAKAQKIEARATNDRWAHAWFDTYFLFCNCNNDPDTEGNVGALKQAQFNASRQQPVDIDEPTTQRKKKKRSSSSARNSLRKGSKSLPAAATSSSDDDHTISSQPTARELPEDNAFLSFITDHPTYVAMFKDDDPTKEKIQER